MHQSDSCGAGGVEAVKLGQAGFGLLCGHWCEQVEGEAGR